MRNGNPFANPLRNYQMFMKQGMNMNMVMGYNNMGMNMMMNKPNMQMPKPNMGMNMQMNMQQQMMMSQNYQNGIAKQIINNKQNIQPAPQKIIQKKPAFSLKNYIPKTNLNLAYSEMIKESRDIQNFCNWHSFMTSTTPIYIESDSIRILKDIFYAFKNPSLFGIKCTFKLREGIYTHVNYFPAISSINIFLPEQKEICLNLFGGFNNNNTFDNSFDSQLSSSSVPGLSAKNIIQNSNMFQFETISPNCSFNSINAENGLLNLSGLSNRSLRSINYEEKNGTIFTVKNLCNQLKEIEENEPELRSMTLDEVDKESWFSVIWYPLFFDLFHLFLS